MSEEQIVLKLKEQIARIEPIMTAHGGGVEIMEASEDNVVLGLKGHCAGCPLAPVTFGLVLKKYISEALPELKNITYINYDVYRQALEKQGVE